jgi:hypothetical protein
MNEELLNPPTRDEAAASLAEVDRVVAQTRHAIRQGISAPLLILWGCIWIVADVTTQFHPEGAGWTWLLLDVIGILGWWLIFKFSGSHVRSPRGWRYGVFWGVLFFYASLWMNLLAPVTHWPQTAQQWIAFWPMYRRMAAYMHTIPMFAYVIGGLWIDRFFIWLGAVVTALIVFGLFYVDQYFFLWLAATGGGSLVLAGVFIKKCWK